MADEANTQPETLVESPWSKSADEVRQACDTDVDDGLTEEEVTQRRSRFGENHLREHKSKSKWRILLRPVQEPGRVAALAAALVVAMFVGDFIEAGAIIAVVLVNAGIGFFMELGAVRSMEALREMTRVQSTVLRDGDPRSSRRSSSCPAIYVLAESGDMISADMRLVKSSKLEADESILTGESLPVSKDRRSPRGRHCARRAYLDALQGHVGDAR